jgi:hypothetical protein
MSRAVQSEIPTKAGRVAALLLNRQKSTAPRARRRGAPVEATAEAEE